MDSEFYWIPAAVVVVVLAIIWWLEPGTFHCRTAPRGSRMTVTANDGGKCETSMAFGSIGDDGKPLPDGATVDVAANKGGGVSTYALAAWKITERGFQTAWQAVNSAAKAVVGPGRYKMEAVPRGLCLIINNINFEGEIPSLHSAQEIAEPLKELFQKFHFKILYRKDKSANGMMEEVRFVAGKDHSQYDCFVCFVLTHGEDGVLFGSDGKKVPLKEFISAVSDQHCPTLAGKPKLFFVDSCRRGDPIKAALKSLSEYLSSPDEDGDPELIDYFVGYSTQKYKRAYRNNESGNIYTQEFISVMMDQGEREDLLSIMTMVNENVRKRGVYDREGVKWSQFPDIWTKLRKKLYF
ncbi:caspase-8-like [Haliotis rubra]|uniref:caspase-8-like n=1 Tax=Haliotis rubra TaxID=36100 RepID=UPI001EE50D3B|nr:caspase-8-like [Haliotis rubra]